MSIIETIKEHKNELLVATGVISFFVAIGTSINATPKAMQAKEEAEMAAGRELTKKEQFKILAKNYAPTVIAAAAGTACIVAGTKGLDKKAMVFEAAAIAADKAIDEYKHEIVTRLGTEKAGEIISSVEEKTNYTAQKQESKVLVTGFGRDLVKDSLTGRYFYSDAESIRAAVNQFNIALRDENTLTLNDFYDSIGLEHCVLGENLGWNIDDGWVDIRFDSDINDQTVPCLVIQYVTRPAMLWLE